MSHGSNLNAYTSSCIATPSQINWFIVLMNYNHRAMLIKIYWRSHMATADLHLTVGLSEPLEPPPSMWACVCLRWFNFSDRDKLIWSCTEMVNCSQKDCQLMVLPSNIETISLGNFTLLSLECGENAPSHFWTRGLTFSKIKQYSA